MSDNVLVALISSSSSVAVAVTALVLSYRGFASIDQRMNSIERRLELIEQDLKQFFRELAEHDKRITRLGE